MCSNGIVSTATVSRSCVYNICTMYSSATTRASQCTCCGVSSLSAAIWVLAKNMSVKEATTRRLVRAKRALELRLISTVRRYVTLQGAPVAARECAVWATVASNVTSIASDILTGTSDHKDRTSYVIINICSKNSIFSTGYLNTVTIPNGVSTTKPVTKCTSDVTGGRMSKRMQPQFFT